MIISFISFESVFLMFLNKLLEEGNYNLLINYFNHIKESLEKNINLLNAYIIKKDYSIINDTDLDEIYNQIEISKENIKNFLSVIDDNNLYKLVDDIYTLLNQFEDRISVLESYRDILNAN